MGRQLQVWTQREFVLSSLLLREGTQLIVSSTEQEIATVEAASAEDVDKAVRAARAAFKAPTWKKLPATERGKLLVRLSELIEEQKELFASIDAWDNGMTSALLPNCPSWHIDVFRQNLCPGDGR